MSDVVTAGRTPSVTPLAPVQSEHPGAQSPVTKSIVTAKPIVTIARVAPVTTVVLPVVKPKAAVVQPVAKPKPPVAKPAPAVPPTLHERAKPGVALVVVAKPAAPLVVATVAKSRVVPTVVAAPIARPVVVGAVNTSPARHSAPAVVAPVTPSPISKAQVSSIPTARPTVPHVGSSVKRVAIPARTIAASPNRHVVIPTAPVPPAAKPMAPMSGLLTDSDVFTQQLSAAHVAGWVLQTVTSGTARQPRMQVVASKDGEKDIVSAEVDVGDSRTATWRTLAASVLRHTR